MTTTTLTRALPKLPDLERASVPPEFASVSPDLKKLIAKRGDMLTKATAARADFNRQLKAIEQARAEDARALTEAALNGKPDPGRPREEEALANLDEAHRQAEALTLAANQVTYEVRDHLKGDTGTKALEKLEAQREKALESLRANAEACLDDLATITATNQLAETIDKTRKGKSRAAVANGTARTLPVSIHGQPVDPSLVLHALTGNYGGPDNES